MDRDRPGRLRVVHGLPPGGFPPASDACASCHPGSTASTVAIATHVDGKVDLGGVTCTTCHGDASRAPTPTNPQLPVAPPRGTHGETDPAQRAVGAHQAHLGDGPLRVAMPCDECHRLPSEPLHQDGLVDLAFGGLARTGGAAPSWTGTGCAATYCHGAFPNGSVDNTPTWTGGSAQAACGSCHALPPGGRHPASDRCGACHPGFTVDSVDPQAHVNGVVDFTSDTTCTSCHGDATRANTALNPRLSAAPPQGTHGETTTNQRPVGAHPSHLRDGALRGALACTECHVVPRSILHADGVGDLAFGALARSGGLSPSWDGTTCSATYCHGASLQGGTLTQPVWTTVNATQAACGTCHGLSPATGHHAQHGAFDCRFCHGAGFVGLVTPKRVNTAVHLDGSTQVGGAGSFTTAYDPGSRSCTSTCHEPRTW